MLGGAFGLRRRRTQQLEEEEEEQAEAYKKYQLAIGKVSRAIWDANGGSENNEWEISNEQGVGCVTYNGEGDDLIPMGALPRCKDKETAEQIIKDYKPELETIRNYKR